MSSKLAESIDRSLVSNRKLLVPPFDDPAYDRGNRHSVPKDYVTAGFAYSVAAVPTPPSTWRGFFRLAAALPGRVAVPPDRDIVIGAALTAAGHDWNSSSSSDITDAADILLPLRPDLVIVGVADRRRLPNTLAAALCFGPGFAAPPAGVRFAVPAGRQPRPGALLLHPGLCARSRLGPRVAQPHLEPTVAAAETRYTGRATPVGPARLPASDGADRKPGGVPAGAATNAAHVRKRERVRGPVAHRPLGRVDGGPQVAAAGTVDSECRSGSRDALGRRGKSGHRRARVPGNSRTGKPDGKRNREQTADRRPSWASRQG